MTPRTSTVTPAAPARPLVSLLGVPRAAIVERLRRDGEASVSELAEHLGVSEVATRRHLAVLEQENLVVGRTVPQGRGRPPARYRLTDAAGQLYPQGYDRFAAEMLDFLADTQGREGLRAFLRWRLEREVDGLRDAITAEDLHDRLEQLANTLSDAGFEASVTPDGDGFALTQEHCAIYDVAKDHPEICAYEAATFSKVLGRDVTLSRRQTLAGGSPACVCSVAPRPDAASSPTSVAQPHRATDPPTDLTTDPTTPATSTSHEGRGDEL